jgi:MYXO-CTERM domain-containing protein
MRPRWVSALVLLATVSLPVRASAEGGPRKGPFLQHLGSESVEVKVELSRPGPVTVEVAVDGQDAAPVKTFSSAPAEFHAVHVVGLAPDTRYRYAVRAGLTLPLRGTFVTAPAPASHEPFTFIAFGDNRSDDAAHAQVVQAMAKESFAFLVNTGDYVIGGGDEDAWRRFFDVEGALLRDHCLFACIGNHELLDDGAAAHFERYLGPVDPPPPSGPVPPLYGSFRWGRARFFLLNAFEDWSGGPEPAWLESELSRADAEPGVDLRVAVIHHGLFSSGPHGPNKRLQAARLDDVLTRHHVDLLLEGHDHIYERGESGAIKYVLTGGGGAPLYRDVRPAATARKVESTHHYVLVTVNDAGVSMVAKRPDGSVIETCSFARGGSWLCDPPPAPAEPSKAEPPSVPPPGARCGCTVPGGPGTQGAVAGLGVLAVVGLGRRRRGERRGARP